MEDANFTAHGAGMSKEYVPQFRKMLLDSYFDGFHRALMGEPLADVKPMQVTLKACADLALVKAKPRLYPTNKSACLRK